MHDDDETVVAALRAGARGYLLKGAHQDDIRRAVQSVVAGEMVVAPTAAAHVLARLAADVPRAAPFPDLTPRERDVLAAMARGRRNGAIAAELGLAAKTVGNHVSAILAKLGVETRAEAVACGREAGLGGEP